MTRVLIVDDHPIVLQGCRRLLVDFGIADIVEASSIAAGYREALRHRPHAVVVDLTFSGEDLAGLALIRRLAEKLPDTGIMVFSMHNDPAIVRRALASGALAYVLKDAQSGEFATALGKLLEGKPHLDHDLAVQVAMLRAKAGPNSVPTLTDRENEILRLLGQGHGYDRIAAKLGISAKTVSNASAVMRAKLKLDSLAELIRYALRDGGASN